MLRSEISLKLRQGGTRMRGHRPFDLADQCLRLGHLELRALAE